MPWYDPIIPLLAAGTAGEARAFWPKGPMRPVFQTRDESNPVPIAEYLTKLRELESSPGLAGQSVRQLAQRLRRMQWSEFTEAIPPGEAEPLKRAGGIADKIIPDDTDYDAPPLTTDHVTQELLDFFFSAKTINTARGLMADISHVWMLVDLKLQIVHSPYRIIGEIWNESDDVRPLLSWAGDLANIVNDYTEFFRAGESPAAAMHHGMLRRGAKSDFLGDMDAVNLSYVADRLDIGFKLSDMLENYYKDDALPQDQAKALKRPCSARRFHYFIAFATPAMPANGATLERDIALEVSLQRTEAVELFKTFILDVADDLRSAFIDTEAEVNSAGRALYDRLCARFADFLVAGLATGDAEWPPPRTFWD